jgi:poly-gamma-glutamate synthesis protein (capsule biosynthesis protein)
MAATAHRPGVAYYPALTTYGPSPDEHQNPYNYPGSRPVLHTHAAGGSYQEALAEDIDAARQEADLVVVSWHWGLSAWYSYPGAGPADVEILDYQQEMAHDAIEFGADLVVGHGPHHPQPIEVYRNKIIFYSLGNFVHDNASFRSRTRGSVAARCLVRNKAIHKVGFIPGVLHDNGPPDFSSNDETKDMFRLMQRISEPYGTRLRPGDQMVEIDLQSS